MARPTHSPNGHRFLRASVRRILRSSEAAFAALLDCKRDPEDWRRGIEFAKRFSGHVAAPLTLGYGFTVPPAETADSAGYAAVEIVGFAMEYWQAENQIAGGKATDRSWEVIEDMRNYAGSLLLDPGEAAAVGAAVCRMLRGIFTRFGITAEDLPPCTCAAHDAASDTPTEARPVAEAATATADPVVDTAGQITSVAPLVATGPAAKTLTDKPGVGVDEDTPGDADPTQQSPLGPGASEQIGVYKKLADAAINLNLKGKQKAVVAAIVAAGMPIPIADLNITAMWASKQDIGWRNMAAALNIKFSKNRLRLFRDDNCACVLELQEVLIHTSIDMKSG